ncbi:VWA domain-containing protein [Nocardioides sp. R-C-SC26]|uniref:VWA domain-containing protein n=1 Tax=Nocardioides sp. R-C-SC26 TaxID=2870414 RepID=UPI001E3957F6|nr:VWA domain-containing protein [Nocardioides sp. R-C-SC26]
MPASGQTYPFTAVVDPGDMSLALVLTTISPEIGGVLVRGEKGTAKSTIVRALAAVLPPLADGTTVPLVEMPVGATEDRVLGSLHLEKALAQGKAEYEPGLLVKAHRGLLYVDEVNLLHDHLVDVLLDAAAMGRCTVERDGVSVSREARFVLVGTMNPEEGELRPQLLDRFGLTVEVAAPRDPALRVEVVRRRMAFDADPAAFHAAYAHAETELTARLAEARTAVGQVELGDAMLLRIAEVCSAFDVDGLRGDLVTARTAAAHAAWEGRREVTLDDVRVAARLALPHRRRRNPFDAPGLDESLLDELLGEEPEPDPDPDGPDGPDGPGGPGGAGGPDGDAAPDRPTDSPGLESPTGHESSDATRSSTTDGGAPSQSVSQPSTAGTPFRARLLSVAGAGRGEAGRRSRAVTDTGRRVGARPGDTGAVHLLETLRAAAPHQVARGRPAGAASTGEPMRLRGEDLRVATREGRESNLVLFCVDASGSMAARRRMEQVKTAILSLLLDAYQRRDKVGLVTFRGQHAELALPPTRSVDIAARRLDDLPAGGRTPLAEGLAEAARLLAVERTRDPRRRALLVVVTDGRANAGADALVRAHHVADQLAASGVAGVVVDCESGAMRLGLAGILAARLRAEHLLLAEVSASALTDVVRERVA